MKKILIAICLIVGIQSVSKAQLSLTPHAAPVFPSGNFGNFASTGFGFGLEATYAVDEHVRIGASIDHYRFNPQTFGFNLSNILNTNFKIIPITGTIQYVLPGTVIRPYIGIEAGAYNMVVDGPLTISRTYFGLAPAVGVLYPFNEKLDFFLNTKYQTVFVNERLPLLGEIGIRENIHFIPINLGVSFKFNQ